MNPFKLRYREPDPEEESSVEGERALSSVNKGISLQNKITNWAVMICACVLAGVLLYKYYANLYHTSKQAATPLKDVTRTAATTTLPPLTMPDPEPVNTAPATPATDMLPPLQLPVNSISVSGNGAAGQAPVKNLFEIVRQRRLEREVHFNLDGSAPPADALAAVDAGGASGVGTAIPPGEPSAAPASFTKDAVSKTSFAGSRAYLLADPTFMLTRGIAIPCTMQPAIDTTLTGVVTCVTAEDVTGADNKVSLMDRGTRCTGKQGGGVMHGQRRVGIIWQLCETPQHVLVPLDAGATDFLGRPGIPGTVDNHFWDRFGAAIALSLIADIGPYLIASRQGGNNNTSIAFPSVSGPQEIMTEVLKSTLSIQPTITASQGAQVMIYLAGDVDFREVYQLERMP